MAEAIHSIVLDTFTKLKNFGFDELPHINRLDWVTSSGVIQQEIWHEIFHADLIFCDITGYNANVMFEAGVCAGWKRIEQIVFIRDHFYKGQSPFDMAPLRYTEYELTSDGIPGFRQKVQHLVTQALIAFPDNQGNVEPITLPLHIDFNNGTDDVRIYTPQFAHRRIFNRALKFGSLLQFSHSWASIGKQPFLNISMYFKARFSNPMPGEAWIGVGLRSQHFFANFGHVLYLKKDGRIILVEPNEIPPAFYVDKQLRGPVPIDLVADHEFRVLFDERNLTIAVDEFNVALDVATMPKVFGPGLIRFQSFRTWMTLIDIDVQERLDVGAAAA